MGQNILHLDSFVPKKYFITKGTGTAKMDRESETAHHVDTFHDALRTAGIAYVNVGPKYSSIIPFGSEQIPSIPKLEWGQSLPAIYAQSDKSDGKTATAGLGITKFMDKNDNEKGLVVEYAGESAPNEAQSWLERKLDQIVEKAKQDNELENFTKSVENRTYVASVDTIEGEAATALVLIGFGDFEVKLL